MSGAARMADLQQNLARRFLAVLDFGAPGVAGKWATSMFLRTRQRRADSAAHAPAGATIKRLDSPAGIADAYVWGKSGPIVFLVHGWGADTTAMCSLVRPLRRRGYRVVAFDAPAHGSNDGRQTTMTRFVAGVRDVLERFDPESDVRALVGHSLGGLAAVAALSAARRAPDRLVLISAPSCLNEALRSFVSHWRLSRKVEDRIRAELKRSHGVPIEHWDMRTLATPGRFPTLVVHDRNDSFVPSEEARAVAAAVGGSVRTVITSGLGHARILADPEITALVSSFVADEVGKKISDEASAGPPEVHSLVAGAQP